MTTKFDIARPKMVDYVADQEPWCVYELENGAICKVRIMVTKIVDAGEFTPDGYPLYKIQMQQAIDMTWPDDIEREASARRGKTQ